MQHATLFPFSLARDVRFLLYSDQFSFSDKVDACEKVSVIKVRYFVVFTFENGCLKSHVA